MGWQKVGEGNLSDREYSIEKNEDGDVRVRTVTSVEEDPTVEVDGNATVIMPPYSPGDPIDIDYEDDDQFTEEARSIGISDDDLGGLLDEVRSYSGQ